MLEFSFPHLQLQSLNRAPGVTGVFDTAQISRLKAAGSSSKS